MAETMRDIHNAAFHRRLNQFINESEEVYHPQETWVDGKHILHLLYYLSVIGARTINFVATLNMSGGSVNIGIGQIQSSIRGQGLLETNAWNGILYITEDMSDITSSLVDGLTASATFTETVDINTYQVVSENNLSDDMSNVSVTLGGIFGTIDMTETLEVTT